MSFGGHGLTIPYLLYGVEGVDTGRNLHLPHLSAKHDQNLWVDGVGVFWGHGLSIYYLR